MPPRDSRGRFTKSSSAGDPPLVNFTVTNPVTYLKRWWNRVMANEGVDFRFHIKPVTAVLIALALAGAGFGVGRIVLPPNIPFVKYATPTPTPDPWRETALTGILRMTPNTNKYYLVTPSIEAVTLEIPNAIDLNKFLERRILASGKYNKNTRTLVISDILDLEILPQKPVTIPTTPPIPSPTNTPAPEPTATPTDTYPPSTTPTI